MKDTFITESMTINSYPADTVFQYPEIQKLLDEGYSVKETFCTPITTEHNRVVGLLLTVHLQKSE